MDIYNCPSPLLTSFSSFLSLSSLITYHLNIVTFISLRLYLGLPSFTPTSYSYYFTCYPLPARCLTLYNRRLPIVLRLCSFFVSLLLVDCWSHRRFEAGNDSPLESSDKGQSKGRAVTRKPTRKSKVATGRNVGPRGNKRY